MRKINHFPRFLLTLIVALALMRTASAQVDIKVNIFPPYPSKVTDYTSHPQQVLIVLRSLSNLAQDIQLRGTITGDNGIVLRVDPHYKSPLPIHLNGGETRNLNAGDISQLFDYNDLDFTGITKENVLRGNGLPEGNYQVCVQAFNYNSNQPLSSGQPMGCSNSFPVTSVEPPIILTPFNDQPVSALTTQNFVISWTTPAGAPPSTQYTVSMVEILDNRSPNDAINTATSPLFFQQTVNASNLLLYGPAMPSLTPGRRYALLVAARDPFNSVTFRNNGRSEPIGFIYGDTTGTAHGGTPSSPNAGNGNLPSQTAKGRLTWYYRQSEETAPAAKTVFTAPSGTLTAMGNLPNDAKMIVNATLTDPTFVAGVKPTLQALSNAALPNAAAAPNPATLNTVSLVSLKTAKPASPTAPSTTQQISALKPLAISLVGTGLGSLITTNDPAFFNSYGREAHPMAGTIIKLLATDATIPGSAPQLAGTATTDDQGNFQLSFIPPAAFANGHRFTFNLSVQDNYFAIPDISFTLPSAASPSAAATSSASPAIDLGEIRALANTFRLLAFADDDAKTEIPMANISVYRRADFYSSKPALRTEGNIDGNNRVIETIDGQPYVKVSSINDAYTGTRLFYSNGNGDEYKIRVMAPNFSTLSTSMALTTVQTHPTSPQTIREIYQLTAAPTTFTGSVSQTTGGQIKQAIPGAVVTLYLTNESYAAAMAQGSNKIIPFAAQRVTPSLASPSLVTPRPGTPPPASPSPASGALLKASVNTPVSLVSGLVQDLHAGQMSASTDSAGAFTISNVPVNADPMHYIIRVPGSNLTDTGTIQLTTKGAIARIDYVFNFIAYAVTGRVVDENRQPIPNAILHWASGGSPFPANSDGYYATTDKAGADTLIAHALGFRDQRLPVTINRPLLAMDPPVATAGSGASQTSMQIVMVKPASPTSTFLTAVQTTPAYKQSIAQGNPMDPASFGFTSKSTAAAAWANSVLQPQDNPGGAVSLPDIIMKKNIGRMLLTVRDAKTGSPLAGAAIRIDGTDSVEITGSDGNRYIQGPAGDLQLIVSGPTGSAYAPQEVALTVNESDTAKKVVSLAPGVKVSGQVTASGKPLSGATVAVDGLDYLQATTDGGGHYTLIVSRDTSYTFKAAMSGYVSSVPKTQSFSADGTLDFSLGTASFNISKLLGFPVQIDKITDETGSSARKRLNGSFIDLPGNAVFSARPGASLSFSNLEVDIVNNIAVPVGGLVTTDATELPLKAFNFLPLKLGNNGSQLIVRQTAGDGTAGQLEGMAAIDYSSFMPPGIAPYMDASMHQYVQTAGAGSPQSTAVLPSNGNLTASALSVTGTGTQSFNLYGFTVTLDLAGSSVKADGLHLQGSVSLGSIPLLGNTTFRIQDLWVGTGGYVSGVKVNMSPAPTFSIAGWGATLTGLSFNDNGFSVSGHLNVQIPGSQASEVDFANLSISTDQLYGGSFTIPSAGIDVFGIVKFVAGPTPLSFGRLGSSNVYYIGGSGTVQFPSLFGNMALQFFQIQTNGQFAATVQTNINENFFDVAQVAITDINFHTNNGVGVDVDGNFLLNAIPFVKATVGGVHFGTGGSVSVNQLGLSFSMVGIASVSANLDFVNQPDKRGFSGSGSITIAGLPGANVSFSYFKVPNGISVSAFFQANVIIPVAGIFSINNPGGGFSLNTGDGSWSVTITGDASVTGLGTAVSVANINVTVTNGPVIQGSANLQVFTLNLAKASMVVDIPKSLLNISFNAGIDLIPQVITAQGSGTFVLSGAKNDTYFMIAAAYHSSLLGIFDENANIAAGWGLNIANHPEYSQFTGFIPMPADGVLRGVYLNANSNISFTATGDIYIAKGSIWYKNSGAVVISMGIGSSDYDLSVAALWDCGGSLSISPFGQIASLDIGSSASIDLRYTGGCFSAGAKLAAHLSASIGNCDDNCFTGLCMHDLGPISGVVPEGGKICAYPSLDVGYDCGSGVHLSIDL
ncbi:MAG: hypothetical protein Q8932_04415 [Bacteroidota bacterium]|nr:hypothetical protein [Bacteroidota bacterium]